MRDPRLDFYAAKIVSVHDGDTVDLDIDQGFRHWMHEAPCRFLDVAAPELGTVKAPIRVGLEATEFLLSLLGRDRFAPVRSRGTFGNFGNFDVIPGREPEVIVKTRLTSSREFEKYGRILGTLWLPGESVTVNARMVTYLGGPAIPEDLM